MGVSVEVGLGLGDGDGVKGTGEKVKAGRKGVEVSGRRVGLGVVGIGGLLQETASSSNKQQMSFRHILIVSILASLPGR